MEMDDTPSEEQLKEIPSISTTKKNSEMLLVPTELKQEDEDQVKEHKQQDAQTQRDEDTHENGTVETKLESATVTNDHAHQAAIPASDNGSPSSPITNKQSFTIDVSTNASNSVTAATSLETNMADANNTSYQGIIINDNTRDYPAPAPPSSSPDAQVKIAQGSSEETPIKRKYKEVVSTEASELSDTGAEGSTEKQEDDEGEQNVVATSTAPLGNASGGQKKISAKELIQHVKNQKKKIQEKEAEVLGLKGDIKSMRMRALGMAIDLISRSKLEKRKVRAFHKWLAFAERESAAVEVERVASLAHRASSDLETVKAKLESVNKEKSELELAQKKLRVLLAKAKQQISEQSKAREQLPDNFSVDDVLRKTRGPDGTMWCLIHLKPAMQASASSGNVPNDGKLTLATGVSSSTPTSTSSSSSNIQSHYEWREESLITAWLIQHPMTAVGSDRLLIEKATIEDELQERYIRANQEVEAALMDKQLELDALNDRFEQYRRRAELALEKAESTVHVHDNEAETALKEELTRVSRDRDAVTSRLEDLRARLDASESSLSALRLREKNLREERDDLERRANEASRALEVARLAWEQSLVQSELENENRLRAERNQARAAEARVEQLEHQLTQALQREAELKDNEKTAQEKLSRADDRIEALRAAVTRAEAKASSAEISRHLASSNTSAVGSVGPSPAQSAINTTGQSSLHLATQGLHSQHRLPSVGSTLSSPRFPPSKSTSAAALSGGAASESVLEGDSASVVEAMMSTGRPRKDSENSEMSNSLVAGTVTEVGSKYFVDQIGALRAAHRNERVEWQRERASLRSQIDDAIKRKEMADEKIHDLERKITELDLAFERQKQLADSARTVGETPDGLLYLKNAVFRFITADDDSERETLLPVITMLLKFSPEEVQVLSRESVRSEQSGGGLLGGLLSRWT